MAGPSPPRSGVLALRARDLPCVTPQRAIGPATCTLRYVGHGKSLWVRGRGRGLSSQAVATQPGLEKPLGARGHLIGLADRVAKPARSSATCALTSNTRAPEPGPEGAATAARAARISRCEDTGRAGVARWEHTSSPNPCQRVCARARRRAMDRHCGAGRKLASRTHEKEARFATGARRALCRRAR